METGNLTRAAQELNVAQTALGLQIRNLEQELGVTLIERYSRGVTVTPCGAILNRHAAEILERIDAAKAAVRARAGLSTATLRFGLTPSIVRLVGDAILQEFAPMLGGTELNLVEEFSFILAQQMAQGELSCALSYSADTDPRYDRRALLEEDLFLMVPGDDPQGGAPVAFREIAGYDLVLTAKQDVLTKSVEEIAARLGVTLNIAYQVQSLRAVKDLVVKRAAATVMPFGAAEGEIRSGLIVPRPIVSPSVVRTLVFLSPKDREAAGLGPEVDAFVDAIAERLHAAPGPVTRRL
ncbi:HTH-type transcriptional regulator CynR [Roseivivax jejudonensis]|uniref:HTH-type transcriptional regulator CynR n=1 Tax=Roseivivax jejudonensis TaxID=1529041 RepID=A0A1X6ZXV5_9RHOB|nr:HTH-type transcriptional regulator CynR [Roseivivax jejudonensis]